MTTFYCLIRYYTIKSQVSVHTRFLQTLSTGTKTYSLMEGIMDRWNEANKFRAHQFAHYFAHLLHV